jgi:16S rRNA (uracil1498-N3)-methyltransferase
MPRFFTDQISGETVRITGADAAHIAKVLRMRPGERLTVCDCRGSDLLCEITEVSPACVLLRIRESAPSGSEPSVRVTLYQALPKADKMELIVQKSVELGVHRIVPVLSARCVSRPDEKALRAKAQRWARIAAEAAKQSGRGILPEVAEAMPFERAAGAFAEQTDGRGILFYERSGGRAADALAELPARAAVFIGPEGGFEEAEVTLAAGRGIRIAGLGPRILRAETAPLCALAAIMFATGNI